MNTAWRLRVTLGELWRYRALIFALVQRHVLSRYRGSMLGFMWTILHPLCLMGVYVLVFHYYMRSNLVENYAAFMFCGLLPWLWTASSLGEGAAAITQSGHLITKSLFPAHILPLVVVVSNLVNFLLSLPLLLGFLLWSGISFNASIFLLPLIILLHLALLFGLTLCLSSINVLLRDVQHLVGSLLSFLFFLCPIVYPAKAVPPQLSFTLLINPFALLTTHYHKILFEGASPDSLELIYLLAWAALTFLVGTMVYHRYRESFAEML